MPRTASYLFLELALLFSVYVFTGGGVHLRLLYRRQFLVRAAMLFLLWFVIDEVAVSTGIWFFPAGGTLPVRIAGLPIEEHLLFMFHTVVCQMFVTARVSR